MGRHMKAHKFIIPFPVHGQSRSNKMIDTGLKEKLERGILSVSLSHFLLDNV